MTGRRLLTVPGNEWLVLDGALTALGIDEVAGEALFLRVTPEHHRWIARTAAGQFTMHVDHHDDDLDDEGEPIERGTTDWIGVSERIRRFAMQCGGADVELSIADASTIVAISGMTAAAIDAVEHAPRPDPVPLRDPVATSRALLVEFMPALGAARSLPAGVHETTAPMPPMWLQLDEHRVTLHVDWTEHRSGRATYWVQTEGGEGAGTVSIPHQIVERFLEHLPLYDPEFEGTKGVTFTIGTALDGNEERPALTIEDAGWRLLLWLADPLEERWAATIEDVLLEQRDLRIVDLDELTWSVLHRGHQLQVSLHAGHPDIARVSAALAVCATESLELWRELASLNGASDGPRYWLADDVVWVADDVVCRHAAALLPIALDRIVGALDRYGPMIAVHTGAA